MDTRRCDALLTVGSLVLKSEQLCTCSALDRLAVRFLAGFVNRAALGHAVINLQGKAPADIHQKGYFDASSRGILVVEGVDVFPARVLTKYAASGTVVHGAPVQWPMLQGSDDRRQDWRRCLHPRTVGMIHKVLLGMLAVVLLLLFAGRQAHPLQDALIEHGPKRQSPRSRVGPQG